MKRILIAASLIWLITLCTNAQTNNDSKSDSVSKAPDITVPEYQKYPFNPENSTPNASPGVTMPSINAPSKSLPSNIPGNISTPGKQIAPDTMKLPGINKSPSPGVPAPIDMSPSPASPALPSTPGIPDNQTPLPD